jgi:hypothetical protein
MRPLSIDWGENNDFRMCVTAKSLMKIPYSRPEQYLLQLHFKKVQKKFHIYLSSSSSSFVDCRVGGTVRPLE